MKTYKEFRQELKEKDSRLEKAGVKGYNQAKRTPGHPKKSHIVVAKDGDKVKTIRFGEQGASTAGDPKKGESDKMKKKRASFKARHAKNIAKGKMSAAYWADKEKWQDIKMSNDIDFGFTAVDEDDLKGLTGQTERTEEVSEKLDASSEQVKLLEYKMDNVVGKLDDMLDEVSTVKEYYENEKVLVGNKLNEVEELILPLLNNLMKNKDKEYIYWPNREAIINQQIERITNITRAN